MEMVVIDSGSYFDGGEYESFGLYPFLSPARMCFFAALHRSKAPLTDRAFRYCELGCGQAHTLLLNAALFPHADFVGVDFSTDAIARAQATARNMGLENIEFVASDFAAFHASRSDSFDFIVAHGVWTWVGRDAQQSILDIVRDRLTASGIVCVSANILAGWHRVLPLQHYLLCATAGAEADDRPSLAKTLLNALLEKEDGGGAGAGNLSAVLRQSPSYFSHEYLVPAWQPTTLLELNARMQSGGVAHVGSVSANFAVEHFWVPKDALPLVPPHANAIERQSAFDAMLNTSFRIEMFGRHPQTLEDNERLGLIDGIHLWPTIPAQLRKGIESRLAKLGFAPAALTDALMAKFTDGGVKGESLANLAIEDTPSHSNAVFTLAASMLVGNFCDLLPKAGLEDKQQDMLRALNQSRIALAADGHEIRDLVSPLSGALVPVDPIDVAHLVAASHGGNAADIAFAIMKRKEAKALINGATADDQDATMKRMIARICAVWWNANGRRLQMLGIKPI